MSAPGTSKGGPDAAPQYEIRVEGLLDEGWTTWFDGLRITAEGHRTVLSGPLPDESALHGILTRIHDLGLTLISLHRIDPDV
jgi:hypothetical protein